MFDMITTNMFYFVLIACSFNVTGMMSVDVYLIILKEKRSLCLSNRPEKQAEQSLSYLRLSTMLKSNVPLA